MFCLFPNFILSSSQETFVVVSDAVFYGLREKAQYETFLDNSGIYLYKKEPAMRKSAIISTLFLLLTVWSAAAYSDCYSIVAGKNATADGSVLFGHNEDNARKFTAGMWKVERAEHGPDETVALQSGARIPQSPVTWGYWWMQMPELDYSDGFLNEHGVAIATDNCPSREDNPELTQGGIGGAILRRLVAERSRTAREGVKVVGELVERYGYTASGRTMIICDSNEGWLVALVNGKHWVAQRVPDDKVAIVANTYTIREIDLTDTDNFLGSADIVEYAVKRGWYDPSKGPFSFEEVYANPKTRVAPGNTHRQWSGLRRIADAPVPVPEKKRLPFAVVPKETLTMDHIASILRDHYEGTQYEPNDNYSAAPPHRRHTSSICGLATNSSSIFQLRSGMPVEIGAVWWLAMWTPCSTPYMPIYLGTDSVPGDLGFDPASAGTCPFCVISPDFGPAYRTFHDLSLWVDEDYSQRIGAVRDTWSTMEKTARNAQTVLEKGVLASWGNDTDAAREILSRYSHGVVSRAVGLAREMMAADNDLSGVGN